MKSNKSDALSFFLATINPKFSNVKEKYQFIRNPLSPMDRKNKKKILEAIELDAYALRTASESLCNDRKVVKASIRKKGLSLLWASRAFRGDKQLVLEAIKNNSYAIRLASKAIQNDLGFIHEAYHLNPNVIKFIDKELINQNKQLQKLLADFESKKNIK